MEKNDSLQKRYDAFIEHFKKVCLQWGWSDDESKWNTLSLESAIFNTDLEKVKIEQIKYIVVADNPGKNERDNARYLFDNMDKKTSGYIAHRIFDKIFPKESYLVLNKCPLYTNVSSGLGDVDQSRLEESMKYMAKLIYNINCINPEIHVFIFGINGLFDKEEKKVNNCLWTPFFDCLVDLYKGNPNFPTLVKHFSRQHIFDDFIVDSDNRIHIKPRLRLDDLEKCNTESFLQELEELEYSDYLKTWEHKTRRRR